MELSRAEILQVGFLYLLWVEVMLANDWNRLLTGVVFNAMRRGEVVDEMVEFHTVKRNEALKFVEGLGKLPDLEQALEEKMREILEKRQEEAQKEHPDMHQ